MRLEFSFDVVRAVILERSGTQDHVSLVGNAEGGVSSIEFRVPHGTGRTELSRFLGDLDGVLVEHIKIP